MAKLRERAFQKVRELPDQEQDALANDRQQMQDWPVEAVKKGIDAADRGKLVPHDEVRAWAKSLGTRRPRPVPKSE